MITQILEEMSYAGNPHVLFGEGEVASAIRLRRVSLICCLVGVLMTLSATATSTVEIKKVAQRWPWNNKLDITYEVTGGQDVSRNIFRRLVFTAVIDGVTNVVDGVHDLGANASNGVHTVTWTAPSGHRTDNCTMSAALYPSDTPSGDDYMIVNLETHEVSYEGLLATQADSNSRYNDVWYKTTNMVFRKVAAGGPYRVGDTATGLSNNTPTNRPTDRTYYIGVFPVTQWQYQKVFGSRPSSNLTDVEGNNSLYRPVTYVRWNDLRVAETKPDEDVPVVNSNTGTFLQRLNFITGNKFGIDLPTEIMWEIAARAGRTTPYFWGTDVNLRDEYVVYKAHLGGSYTMEVGSCKPNDWGLYDVVGNVYEWCRDDAGLSQLADAPNPWMPSSNGHESRRTRGGQAYNNDWNQLYFRTSYRASGAPNSWSHYIGFRLAWIVK